MPGSALAAGGFTWAQPGDVNSTAQYGVQSWSYSASGATLSHHNSFADPNGGTLAGYTDSTSSPTTWIAAPSSGALQMVPAVGQAVTLTWTSPFPTPQTVTVSGSIGEPGSTLVCGTSWTLSSGTAIANGTGGAPISSSQVTVQAHGTIVLTATDRSTLPIFYSSACDETDVTLNLAVTGTAPTVSLATPTANQTVTSEAFSGAASTGFPNSSQVTVRVCGGTVGSCGASSSPEQTVTAAVQNNGSWSVTPPAQLPNGTYTVQAEQDDQASPVDVGLSSAVTFTLNNPNPPPTVTIDSLGNAPLTTSTPTVTGTAGTASGDSGVTVYLFSGTSTAGTPVRTLTASVAGSGKWSAHVTPALANGTYTALAAQVGSDGQVGESPPMTFTIQATVPTGQLTLTEPASGSSVSQAQLVFGGSAATAAGDSATVTITVWKGDSATGKPLGTTAVTESGGTWSAKWPHQLALGLYTVEASQSTPTGVVTTPSHRFLIVPGSGTVGNAVQLSHNRVATVSITCLAPSGDICTGSILVDTVKTFQPTPGGPKGSVRLAFAYVSITSGQTQLIRHTISRAAYRALHRQKNLKVHVITLLTEGGGSPTAATVTRTLKIK